MQHRGKDTRNSEQFRDLGQNMWEMSFSASISAPMCGMWEVRRREAALSPHTAVAFPLDSPLCMGSARAYCLIHDSLRASGWYVILIPMVKMQEIDVNKSRAKEAQG